MFEDFEGTTEGGRPIELYEFRAGSEIFRFTSSEDDYLFNTLTWNALPISRGKIASTLDSDQDKLEVELPASQGLARQFLQTVPGRIVSLTIYRLHRDDPDQEAITIYRGAVHAASFVKEGRAVTFQVLPETQAFSRPVPRFTFGSLCSHMLYDARCKIDEHDPDFEKFLDCVDADGDTIELDGAGAFGADFFEQGFVQFQGDYRMVTAQSGDVLTLLLPFATSPVGFSVRALAGCKLRLVADCTDKFSNAVNFGGFPYVPLRNPFVSGIDA